MTVHKGISAGSELRIAPCDGCGKEAPCYVRVGTAGKGDPQKTTWFLQPPGWWSGNYYVKSGVHKGVMIILSRCPDCIDEAAKGGETS